VRLLIIDSILRLSTPVQVKTIIVGERTFAACENRIGAIIQLIFDLLIGTLVGNEIIILILVSSAFDCSIMSKIYFFIRRVVFPTRREDIA
jgi:hypothetical protein